MNIGSMYRQLTGIKKTYNNEHREKKCGRFHRGRKKEEKNYYVLGNQCSVLTQYSPLNDFN